MAGVVDVLVQTFLVGLVAIEERSEAMLQRWRCVGGWEGRRRKLLIVRARRLWLSSTNSTASNSTAECMYLAGRSADRPPIQYTDVFGEG